MEGGERILQITKNVFLQIWAIWQSCSRGLGYWSCHVIPFPSPLATPMHVGTLWLDLGACMRTKVSKVGNLAYW